MLDEKKIQQAIDRRLSGFAPSDARKMRIREAVYAQRREDKPVKKKLTLVTAIAVAVMMMASVAVAAGLGLFGELAQSGPDIDRRLNTLDVASTYINKTFTTHNDAKLTVHQAYYTGDRVFVSYSLEGNLRQVETGAGKPENVEWDSVRENHICAEQFSNDIPEVQAMYDYLDGTEPRWGRSVSVGVHDSMYLPDGSYLDITGGDFYAREDGVMVGWKECIVPEGIDAEELEVQIGTYLIDTLYYQDEKDFYIAYQVRSRDTKQLFSFTVKKSDYAAPVTGSVSDEDWSAVANLTLSAIDLKGEVIVKAPQSWHDYWLDRDYTGEEPDCIDDWQLYVNGKKAPGHNFNGGIGPAGAGELKFYVLYEHIDPTNEVMLVPHFTNSGAKPEWGIILKVAE